MWKKITKKEQLENTKKWDKTGLLDELNNKQKSECALILEKVAQILVKQAEPLKPLSKEYNIHDQYCGFVIPMVRRIYSSIYPKKFPDIDWFMKDSRNFWDKTSSIKDDCKNLKSIDIEGEMCEMYEKVCILNMEKL